MNVADRMMQMATLCRLSGWNRDEFQRELEERYPNGPSPEGPPWSDPDINRKVDNLYNEAMR